MGVSSGLQSTYLRGCKNSGDWLKSSVFYFSCHSSLFVWLQAEKEYIFKLLAADAKLNQVSFPLKKIKFLLCTNVLMRTELADIDKWKDTRESMQAGQYVHFTFLQPIFHWLSWMTSPFLKGPINLKFSYYTTFIWTYILGMMTVNKAFFFTSSIFTYCSSYNSPLILLHWWNTQVVM